MPLGCFGRHASFAETDPMFTGGPD